MNQGTLDRDLHAIYQTVSNPNRWSECIEAIGQSINAKSGMIGFDDVVTKTPLSSERFGFSPDQIPIILKYSPVDIWVQNLIKSGIDTFGVSEQFVPYKKFLASGMFDGYCRDFDMHHATGVYIDKSDGIGLRMAFHRSRSQGGFDAKEVPYLNTLLPHLKRAANLAKLFQHARLSSRKLDQSLDALPYGAMILNEHGCVLLSNTAAERCLNGSSQCFSYSNAHIKSVKGVQDSDYFGLLNSLTRSEKLAEMPLAKSFLVRSHEGGHLVEFNRFEADMDDLNPLVDWRLYSSNASVPCVLVLIKKLGASNGRKMQELDSAAANTAHLRLEKLYHLTKAESDISAQLCAGLSPADISKIRFRSVDTIRTQIKTIQTKMNVHSTNKVISNVARLTGT